MNAIDKFVSWWLNRQREKEISQFMQEHSDEVKINDIDFSDDRMEVEMEFPGLGSMIASLSRMLDKNNAKNYIQFVAYPSLTIHPDLFPVEVTVRRYPGGEIPGKQCQRLQKETADLLMENERLRAQLAMDGLRRIHSHPMPTHDDDSRLEKILLEK